MFLALCIYCTTYCYTKSIPHNKTLHALAVEFKILKLICIQCMEDSKLQSIEYKCWICNIKMIKMLIKVKEEIVDSGSTIKFHV